MKKNSLSLKLSIIFVLIVISMAVLAPVVAPYNPYQIHKAVLSPPSSVYLLGTDRLGRDLLSRMIYGSRISMEVGLIAVGISTIIGVLLGGIAGFKGGLIDALIMRLADVFLAFPVFFLILAIISYVGPGIINIMIVIGLTSWMGVARMVRAEIMRLKKAEFILSSRLMGQKEMKILIYHLIPNSLAPVIVNATLGIGIAILTESSLSFLGIGVEPPTASWGSILSEGKDFISIAWWLSLFPGVAILMTVLSFTVIGDKLQKRL